MLEYQNMTKQQTTIVF